MELNWQAKEYVYQKKSSDWFWFVWIISFSIVFVSIINHNAIFAILIILISFSVSLQATRKPETMEFKINSDGVFINGEKHSYKTIEGYDINTDKEDFLLLKIKNKLFSVKSIPLGNQIDPREVDEFLSDFIKKEDIEIPLLEKLTKYI